MKLKTLLLGSAGALAVAGGAQAADLSVAEPVEYVKVCDAFGAGYWYIPGTDTCLKIGGYVRFEAAFHTAIDVFGFGSSGNGSTAIHSAAWEFKTKASVNVTAKSMTEYGPLTGFVNLEAWSDNAHATNFADVHDGSNGLVGTRLVYLDTAWLELGPLLVGRLASAYDYGGALANFDGDPFDPDSPSDQVRLTWAMSGFGVILGIEDPRDRWGTDLSYSYSMPNIVAAITASQAHWDGKLSVGWGESTWGSGFGVQGAVTIKLNEIAKGDALRLKASWAQSQVSRFGGATGPFAGGSVWSALVSFQHFWSPQLYSSITGSYLAPSSTGASWAVAANLVWAPVTGFIAGVEAVYTSTPTVANAWTAKIRLQRSW